MYKNNCIYSYENAIRKFLIFCKRNKIKYERNLLYNNIEVSDVMKFSKDKKEVTILAETIQGNYSPIFGPKGHFIFMKELIKELC